MTDNYLVNLLFKDGRTGISNGSVLRNQRHEMNESFGAELMIQSDFICPTESALSSDYASSADEVFSAPLCSTPIHGSWGIQEPDSKNLSVASAASRLIDRSTQLSPPNVGTQPVPRSSGYSQQQHPSDPQSQISERLQSFLQADDLGLDSFPFQPPWSVERSHDNTSNSQFTPPRGKHQPEETRYPQLSSITLPGRQSESFYSGNPPLLHSHSSYSNSHPLSASDLVDSDVYCNRHAALLLFQLGVGVGEVDPTQIPISLIMSFLNSTQLSSDFNNSFVSASGVLSECPRPSVSTIPSPHDCQPDPGSRRNSTSPSRTQCEQSTDGRVNEQEDSSNTKSDINSKIDVYASPIMSSRQVDASSEHPQPSDIQNRSDSDCFTRRNSSITTDSSTTSLSTKSSRSMILGKYAPRHLVGVAVSVPTKLYRKLRTGSHQPPVIPEEPTEYKTEPTVQGTTKCGEVTLNDKSFTTRQSLKSKDNKTTKEQKSTVLSVRTSEGNHNFKKTPGSFASIPCIQGALSVRHTTSSSRAAAGSAVAATVARSAAAQFKSSSTAQYKASEQQKKSEKGWTAFGSRSRVSPSSNDQSNNEASNCWKNVVGWHAFNKDGTTNQNKLWSFLEAADYRIDSIDIHSNITIPLLNKDFQLNLIHHSSPVCSQQSTAASLMSNYTSSSSSSSSHVISRVASRSTRKEVGLGVVLGTGDPEKDRNSSQKGLQQYVKLARSIRRISRAFQNLMLTDAAEKIAKATGYCSPDITDKKELEQQSSTTESHDHITDPTKLLRLINQAKSGLLNKGSAPPASRSTIPLGSSFDKKIIELSQISREKSIESKMNEEGDNPMMNALFNSTSYETNQPCKASCWIEVINFVQSIFRLQLRRKKIRTMIAAARCERKKQQFSTAPQSSIPGRTNDNRDASAKPDKTDELKLNELVNNEIDENVVEVTSEVTAVPTNGGLSDSDKDILSSAYWIVFVALWIEKKIHYAARISGDPSIIQRFCCCRLFTSNDLVTSNSSTSNPSMSSKSYRDLSLSNIPTDSMTASHSLSSLGTIQVSSSPSIYGLPLVSTRRPSPILNSLSFRSPSTTSSFHNSTQHYGLQPDDISSSFCFSDCSYDDQHKKPIDFQIDLTEPTNSRSNLYYETASNFAAVESINLENETEDYKFNWGAQIDTLRRFLVLCFCAWSWIEDENITSGNFVSVLQHIWWCINSQINIGISDMARKRRCVDNQKNSSPLMFVSSNHRKSTGTVSRITSGARLLAQYFGQQQQQQSETNIEEEDETDYYAEYLGLPMSCSASDFEAQVFFLMKTLKFKLGIVPELIVPLSIRWRHDMENEQCCSKAEGYDPEGLGLL